MNENMKCFDVKYVFPVNKSGTGCLLEFLRTLQFVLPFHPRN